MLRLRCWRCVRGGHFWGIVIGELGRGEALGLGWEVGSWLAVGGRAGGVSSVGFGIGGELVFFDDRGSFKGGENTGMVMAGDDLVRLF